MRVVVVVLLVLLYPSHFAEQNLFWEADLTLAFRKIIIPFMKPGGSLSSSYLIPETGYADWIFRVFFSVCPYECQDIILKLGHDRFLPNPFQFIIQLSPLNSTLFNLSYWKNVAIWTTHKLSSQNPTTGPYPEGDEFSPQSHTPFLINPSMCA
jgi:hypothetical protein